jgi:formylmethanofuran dehydrogenase subunit B
VFWGLDPATRYPRFTSRYAPDPTGFYLPAGRSGRTVIAVDIGTDRGPDAAEVRVTFAPEEEVAALALVRMALAGRATPHPPPASIEGRAATLAEQLRSGRYVAIVADGEPTEGRDAGRGEGLLALAEALNGPTRGALCTLRAGGNRSGADAVLTAQTGYPMAVDFARGVPRYRPEAGAAVLLARGEVDLALVIGAPHSIGEAVRTALATIPTIVIGPRASESPFPTVIAIDTGVAGIHEGGTAFRLDDIPLPLRPALPSPTRNEATSVVHALATALIRKPRAA